ncbi:MAG: MmcQ/YjbR family DNA-binding protein [Rhodothermaceae bacterium]|nr:MmcQ/YjbR family DNA-binding protein [Rhodothermaceae bacterium]
MDIASCRDYCLSMPGTTEGFPFDEDTLVFYVMGKMFCLTDVDTFGMINVKCDPEKAIELRETYEYVVPGYHMNKKHWNSIIMKYPVPDHLLKEWISDSYRLVVAKLPKKDREAIGLMP